MLVSSSLQEILQKCNVIYKHLELALQNGNIETHQSGGNCKESPGKEVEVVWECDEKRRTLRRKEGDGNESTREKEERKA